jgi:glycosyltransferase involved in cell wall biosynthesis
MEANPQPCMGSGVALIGCLPSLPHYFVDGGTFADGKRFVPVNRSGISLTLFLDAKDENWPSMDLVGEMLHSELASSFSDEVTVSTREPTLVRIGRSVPRFSESPLGLNIDRLLTRGFTHPLRSLPARWQSDFFHVVDHSYAQVAAVLPPHRTGVFCHDVDAFRLLLQPVTTSPRDMAIRALAWGALRGMKSAGVVFHSTRAVATELQNLGLAGKGMLVQAPYGVSPEFLPSDQPSEALNDALGSARGHRFLLHVGSGVKRKRLDLLFEIFARVREHYPDLYLVQQGATLDTEQRAHVRRLGFEHRFVQPPKVSRAVLASMYSRAAAVLLPSAAEGFGFPIIEALACGAPVIASDLPVLREVGANAAIYCALGDVDAWTAKARRVLTGAAETPSRAERLSQASHFTWKNHARLVLDAYLELRTRLDHRS